jgi:hypothetical protein
MSGSRRILRWSPVATVVICVGLFLATNAIYLRESRHLWRNDPGMWKVPVELTDRSVSKSAGTKLSYFGYEFEVPWIDLDEQKTRPIGKPPWQVISFHSGKKIVLAIMPPGVRSHALLKGSKNSTEILKLAYGTEAVQFDYALTRAILEATPRQITLFMLPGRAGGEEGLLMIKSIFIRTNSDDPSIFSIQTSELRGFQYGDPQNRPREMVDDLFGPDGHLEFWFFRGRSATSISQAEINRIIQTVRAVHQPASNAAH